MALIACAVLFVIFTTNVVMAAMGAGAFMGDKVEMLVLFATSVLFVIAVLRREAREASARDDKKMNREEIDAQTKGNTQVP